MFMGAIFKTVKGGYDAVALRKKLKEYQAELASDLMVQFPPYERFFARERLMTAEYFIELSKLRAHKQQLDAELELREGMNARMKQLIDEAQDTLAAHEATKLDVARLVHSLRELSLAFDRDMDGFRKDIGSEQQKMDKRMTSLEEDLKLQAGRLKEQSRQAENLETKITALTGKAEDLGKEFIQSGRRSERRFAWLWFINLLILILLVWMFCFR